MFPFIFYDRPARYALIVQWIDINAYIGQEEERNLSISCPTFYSPTSLHCKN